MSSLSIESARAGDRLVARLVALMMLASLMAGCGSGATPPSDEARQLNRRGIAELENEQPQRAEQTFGALRELVPGDPLAPANLAIALLRQQKFRAAEAAIAAALALDADRADLRAIEAEILRWSGRTDEALQAYARAADRSPDDVKLQFATLDVSREAGGTAGAAVAARVLPRLARLRPDNLVVVLAHLRSALAAGERSRASEAALRLREILWQTPDDATALLERLVEALNADDLAAATPAALRLDNLLKPTPAYQLARHELTTGIHGVAVERFVAEAPPLAFGEPVPVVFSATRLSADPVIGASLAAADFDADGTTDLVWLGQDGEWSLFGGSNTVRHTARGTGPDPGGLAAIDLDNDGALELLAFGARGIAVQRGIGPDAQPAAEFAPGTAGARSVAAIDFDIEGDLDLAIASQAGVELLRNTLQGPLEPAGARVFAGIELSQPRAIVATDLDRDGDLDLAVAHATGIAWLDNLRQGRFARRDDPDGLDRARPARAIASADLDNDGRPELIGAGETLEIFHNRGDGFGPWPFPLPRPRGALEAAIVFDANNDGRLDLALAGAQTLEIYTQQPDHTFVPVELRGTPVGAAVLAAADLDLDGDLDLVSGGRSGVYHLENRGGNRNRWLAVRLRGLNVGNSKNNTFGIGSTLEVFDGRAYQFREVQGEVTHFGLGNAARADVVRAVWTNGVPQNRLQVAAEQTLVEEQILKGSCPFLYAWNGKQMAFVTDLLWGAPAGLPLAPGVWAPTDPRELVRVDGARPHQGRYDLRITEELWEAAFFDRVRLWVVDHPVEVEAASNLRILPGAGARPERVLGTRAIRPLAGAWDAQQRDVTPRVRARDEVYADGWSPGPYQGFAAAPWTFTLDLGSAPGASVRLLLDGWIFPADASLNLATAQRSDIEFLPPRLEVDVGGQWQVLMPSMGFPAGKTKTLVIDTPPLPAGARRLRIVSNLWLGWDRIAWSTQRADDAVRVVGAFAPDRAELRYRGFSALRRAAPNAPHGFDYHRVGQASPWLPFPGSYTRYGDVRELLSAADDRLVILASGDEMRLEFDVSDLAAPARGWTRTVFLESLGWDKDADRNTYAAQQIEPLPFRAMSGYPYGADEAFPDTPLHRDYRSRWLTRVVPAAPARQLGPVAGH